jgi:hypothetical protein
MRRWKLTLLLVIDRPHLSIVERRLKSLLHVRLIRRLTPLLLRAVLCDDHRREHLQKSLRLAPPCRHPLRLRLAPLNIRSLPLLPLLAIWGNGLASTKYLPIKVDTNRFDYLQIITLHERGVTVEGTANLPVG